jgi:methylmalonyl-CoA/ethylmalonyl-CoA epimerase
VQLGASRPPDGVDLPDDLRATFEHVAVAAPRIRDLLPLWMGAMGGEFLLGADDPVTGWRTVRLTFGGRFVVELIEPLQGSTLFDKFFQANPRGGVHHVTFLVEDVQGAFARLEAAGYAPFGADDSWSQLFVHPRNASGVLIQLMHHHGDHVVDHTLEDVLAGHGFRGTGVPSP